MKHFFIINPAAGKTDSSQSLESQVDQVCREEGVDYEIHLTTGVGDATEFVKNRCREETGEVRFYACGGDGTLCEVANGLADCQNAELGHIPVGTGNDFVKNFSDTQRFFDIRAQLAGTSMPMDLLAVNDHYSVNMINIGFDCEVVTKTAEIKRKPWVPGKMAYIFGVLMTLVKMPGVKARMAIDGQEAEDVDLQLMTMANGEYCGGGFHSNPLARLRDGLIDMVKVRKVSRTTFLRLIGAYKDGTYVDSPKHRRVVDVLPCREVSMDFGKMQNVCIDGEVLPMERVHIRILPDKIRFSLPSGCELLHRLAEPILPEKEAVR